jgi:hypothetical protein
MPTFLSTLPPLGPPDPPPVEVVRPADRPGWLRRGRIVLASARDELGRAGRPALHRIVDTAAAWSAALAGRLVRGVVGVHPWWRQFLDGLAARHYAGTLALTSGDTPPANALDDLDGRIARQAGYLARFRRQLAQGLMLGPAIVARATLYGHAIWSVAQNVWRGIKVADGKDNQERWVLDDGVLRHCPDCPGLAAMGYVPIGTLPPIGSTACQSRCRCWVTYR